MELPYTFGRAGKPAPATYLMAGLTSSWVRRIMALLRLL
jgi:hypothetical protein